MDLHLLLALKGSCVGLALAIPVGPVGLLVFRRAVAHGTKAGLVTGVGAALADAVLCAIMAFGITAVSAFMAAHATALSRFGGLALIGIGWIIFRTAPPKELRASPKKPGTIAAFSTSLLITVSNPATILGVTGIFAGFGVASAVNTATDATLLVAGVFSGSMLWWCVLSALAGRLRDKASGYWMRRINQACGIALVVFGMASLATHLF